VDPWGLLQRGGTSPPSALQIFAQHPGENATHHVTLHHTCQNVALNNIFLILFLCAFYLIVVCIEFHCSHSDTCRQTHPQRSGHMCHVHCMGLAHGEATPLYNDCQAAMACLKQKKNEPECMNSGTSLPCRVPSGFFVGEKTFPVYIIFLHN